MEKMQPVKGTRDFYPNQMAFRRFLTDKMRQVAQQFGYEEYDGPILEPFELYAAKSGDELVNQQSFVFEDRGGRKIVLRPELTPSLARMVAQQQQSLPKLIKWFSIGSMWRYEQPQKGRAREFLQWNVDCLGSDSPLADAEVIVIAITFLESLGLNQDDVEIRLNDRKWFEQKLASTKIPADKFTSIIRAVDRRDKMAVDAWKAYVLSLGITEDQYGKLITLLSDTSTQKDDAIQQVYETVASYGYAAYVKFDVNVVRGLDYYTGTVFEIRDKKGELRAIGGGGRYGNLVEQVGGKPLAGVGFALGDMPVEELLRQTGKYPENLSQTASYFVTSFDAATYPYSTQVAQAIRNKNNTAELYVPTKDSFDDIKNQLSYAAKKGFSFVVLIGSQEMTDQTVTVKDFSNGSQKTIAFASFVDPL